MRLSAGLDYFHANSGCYEPVVELFPIIVNIQKLGQYTDTSLLFNEPINLNLTIGLATVIANF